MRLLRRACVEALGAAALLVPSIASAGPRTAAAPPDAPAPAGSATTTAPKQATPRFTGKAAPRRPVPDYDGRPEHDESAAPAWLWVPRVVFSPLYFVAEFLLRRPIGWAVGNAERAQLPVKIVDFFTFGEDRGGGIVPTAFIDFGLNPSVGVYAWWDDVGARGNDLRLQLGTWGKDWLAASLTDRIRLTETSSLALRGSWLRRPDRPFYGLGPDAPQTALSRYGQDLATVEATGDLDLDGFRRAATRDGSPRGHYRLRSNVGLRRSDFHTSSCCDEPDLAVRAAEGAFELPPGYPRGYTVSFQRLELVVDSRDRQPAPQTGLRAALYGEHGADHSARGSWIGYGGSAAAYLDLGRLHVVGLKGHALFVDPLRGVIPFTEQVALGGTGLLRGYLPGRLIDRSALVAEIEYRWPIWVWLDGTLQASVGNVYGARLEQLSLGRSRLSAAIGFRSSNSPDHQLEVLTGFGTETFESGAEISSFRLFVGGTRGF